MIEEQVERGLLELAFKAQFKSFCAVTVNACIILVVQWNVTSHVVLLIWSALIISMSMLRAFNARTFLRISTSLEETRKWRREFVAIVIISSICWGSSAFLLMPANDTLQQAMIITVLVGMAGGSVVTLSPVPAAANAFLFLSLLPLIACLLTAGSKPLFALGLMTGLFLFIMWSAARDWQNTLRNTLRIQREQEQTNATIEHLAYHDDLTKLPNRRQLLMRLGGEVARAQEKGSAGALLFLDLDQFKTINDSLGHQIGDQLLVEVSHRLRAQLRDVDMVARLGGDEFVILFNQLDQSQKATNRLASKFVERLQTSLSQTFKVDGHEFQIGSSVGISTYPFDSVNADDLLRFADTAMYCAKAAGRNTMRFFSTAMQEAADRRLFLERGLRAAIDERQLRVHYQPLVSLEDGSVTGVEALVRWQHPQHGLIPPTEFIPLAEESQLIVELGEYVLREACRSLAILREKVADPEAFTMSVNISPRQFYQAEFVSNTINIITSTAVHPKDIQIELTEGVLLADIDGAVEKLSALRRTGMTLAIDDFGTGHSSLAYLKQLPVNTLKIDRAFILNIDSEPTDATIVANTVNMAKQLGLRIVAEGIESKGAIELLRSYGCKVGQGYYYCPPMPLNEALAYLTRYASNVVRIV